MMIRRIRLAALIGAVSIGMMQTAHATLLLPSADTNIEEHTPDSDDTTQARVQVRSRAEAGSGRQNVGYFQFDLTSFAVPFTEASFRLTLQSTNPSAAGANRVYGLNDVAGNTAQDWMNLTYNTVGDEIPGDGNSETQDLGSIGATGTENLWEIGDLPEITGVAESAISIDHLSNPELLNFINSRIGGHATLLVVQVDGVDDELLFNSMEDAANLSPQLNVVPEPSTLTLAAIGLSLAVLRRRCA